MIGLERRLHFAWALALASVMTIAGFALYQRPLSMPISPPAQEMNIPVISGAVSQLVSVPIELPEIKPLYESENGLTESVMSSVVSEIPALDSALAEVQSRDFLPDLPSAILPISRPETLIETTKRPVAAVAQPQPAKPQKPASQAQPAKPQKPASQPAPKAAPKPSAPAKAQPAPKAPSRAEINAYAQSVQRKIARTRQRGSAKAGSVVIALSIAGNGQISGLGVAKSSGNAATDDLALKHVQRSGPFAPTPGGKPLRFNLPVVIR